MHGSHASCCTWGIQTACRTRAGASLWFFDLGHVGTRRLRHSACRASQGMHVHMHRGHAGHRCALHALHSCFMLMSCTHHTGGLCRQQSRLLLLDLQDVTNRGRWARKRVHGGEGWRHAHAQQHQSASIMHATLATLARWSGDYLTARLTAWPQHSPKIP